MTFLSWLERVEVSMDSSLSQFLMNMVATIDINRLEGDENQCFRKNNWRTEPVLITKQAMLIRLVKLTAKPFQFFSVHSAVRQHFHKALTPLT